MQQEINALFEKLSAERDAIKLQLRLASMDIQDEFSEAEKRWNQIRPKAEAIANDTVEITEELIKNVRVISEELSESYQRIKQRLDD